MLNGVNVDIRCEAEAANTRIRVDLYKFPTSVSASLPIRTPRKELYLVRLHLDA